MSKKLILKMCNEVVNGRDFYRYGFDCGGINCCECPFERSEEDGNLDCHDRTSEETIKIAKKYIAENTEFDWEEFKRGSIAVLLDTEEKIDDFLKECDKHDIRWGTAKASERMLISREGISENCYCCYRMYSILEHCYKDWYESEGKTIVKWNIKEKKVVDNKFKVGDKVRCIDDGGGNLCITKGEVYEVEMVHNNWLNVKYNDFHCADYQSFRFELVEEKKTEKTFKEVIADIKEGEVWESEKKTITYFNKRIEVTDTCNNVKTMCFHDSMKYKLQKKQYTFTEAFAAYEEGKEIESEVTGDIFKKQIINNIENGIFINNEFQLNSSCLFSVNVLRGKWYINN